MMPVDLSFNPYGQAPSGFQINPYMREMFLQNIYRLNALDVQGPGGFLHQQAGPLRDILANQAVQSRSNVASGLANRGMLGSGALPAAYGQIEGANQQALAAILPQLLQQYFQQQQMLLGGAAQAGGNTFMQQPQSGWTQALSGLGGLGGNLLGGYLWGGR
jgi:hypothetical protein